MYSVLTLTPGSYLAFFCLEVSNSQHTTNPDLDRKDRIQLIGMDVKWTRTLVMSSSVSKGDLRVVMYVMGSSVEEFISVASAFCL
jgi:hypothetical protein